MMTHDGTCCCFGDKSQSFVARVWMVNASTYKARTTAH